MRVNELVRRARESAGLTDVEIAGRVGLSLAEHNDIEQHVDEFATALSLGKARALGAALRLDLWELVKAAIPGVDQGASHTGDLRASRSLLIETRRLQLGMSQAQLADAIGFDTAAIVQAEKDESFLDTLPIQVLVDVAARLDLPARRLVR